MNEINLRLHFFVHIRKTLCWPRHLRYK